MHHLFRLFTVTVLLATASTAAAETGKASGQTVAMAEDNYILPIVKERIRRFSTSQINNMLQKTHLLPVGKVDDLAYIVGMEDGQLMAEKGSLVYGRAINAGNGTTFDIVRPGDTYRDHKSRATLGVNGRHVGTAVLLGGNNPKTLRVTSNIIEVRPGDRLIPASKNISLKGIKPKRPAMAINGYIIDVLDGREAAGQYKIVTIDRGRKAGVKAGDVLVVNNYSRKELDEWAKPEEVAGNSNHFTPAHNYQTMPQEYAANIMIFRVYDNVSYALVTDAKRAFGVGDYVYNP